MQADMKVKYFLCLLFGLVRTEINFQGEHQECGKRLDSGAIMCFLLNEELNAKPFDFKLCTHALVFLGFPHCQNNKCSFRNTTEVDMRIKWAIGHFPGKVGTVFKMNPSTEKFLFGSKQRRSNTIRELLNMFEYKGLSFLWLQAVNDGNNHRSIPIKDDDFVLFVEELATNFHEHGFHIGLKIDYTHIDKNLSVHGSMQKLSQYLDWYTFEPRNFESSEYLRPWTPLKKWTNGTSGTYQHWIEIMLKLVAPRCLVINLGPISYKFTAKNTAVEPGPGSIRLAKSVISQNLSPMCYIIDSRTDCREYWDDESSTPWAVCGDDFYTYDNQESFRLKAELVRSYNIAGLLYNTDSVVSDSVCNNYDPFGDLKGVQGFRRDNSSTI